MPRFCIVRDGHINEARIIDTQFGTDVDLTIQDWIAREGSGNSFEVFELDETKRRVVRPKFTLEDAG